MYGANRSLLALLDGIDQSKINPHVFIPVSGEIESELKQRKISYSKIPYKNWMAPTRLKMPLRFIANILLLPYLLFLTRRLKTELIHTNSSATPIGAWLAFLSGLPHIWHIREFGWDDYRYHYDLGKKQFKYWMNKADHLICVSKAIEKKVLKGIQAPRTVIYNGVISQNKAEKLKIRSSYGKRNKIYGIIGKFSPLKGQEQAIRAFAKVNTFHESTELLIAGSASKDYEDYLKLLCLKLNVLNNVNFLGFINDPFEFYSQIDVALVCSKNEAMGRVTAEALVAGKIIIGLDNGGTSELIKNKKTGLLYDGSDDSLISKMNFVINNDTSAIAENARVKGLNNFLVENYASKVEGIFLSVF